MAVEQLGPPYYLRRARSVASGMASLGGGGEDMPAATTMRGDA